MPRLKADLHTHTADDPRDPIDYSAEMLIDAVAELNFDVLAIACHGRNAHTRRLGEYARQRDVVLVPASELILEGKHVLVLNPDDEQEAATTFAQLRALGRREAAIMAPHPYFRLASCLDDDLPANIDLFDAIEYSSLYCYGLNLNRKGTKVAEKYGLPLVGTSDTHTFPYCDSTYSWIEAEERSVEAVIGAIRSGRVTVVTRARPPSQTLSMVFFSVRDLVREVLG